VVASAYARPKFQRGHCDEADRGIISPRDLLAVRFERRLDFGSFSRVEEATAERRFESPLLTLATRRCELPVPSGWDLANAQVQLPVSASILLAGSRRLYADATRISPVEHLAGGREAEKRAASATPCSPMFYVPGMCRSAIDPKDSNKLVLGRGL
jgi:hypothetical protein